MRRKPEDHQDRNEEGSVVEAIPYAVSSPSAYGYHYKKYHEKQNNVLFTHRPAPAAPSRITVPYGETA
jgi:hypothetical protein